MARSVFPVLLAGAQVFRCSLLSLSLLWQSWLFAFLNLPRLKYDGSNVLYSTNVVRLYSVVRLLLWIFSSTEANEALSCDTFNLYGTLAVST